LKRDENPPICFISFLSTGSAFAEFGGIQRINGAEVLEGFTSALLSLKVNFCGEILGIKMFSLEPDLSREK
jgi:hypothetical protein